MKINNYFYQFEIEKEWKKPKVLLSQIKNNLTLVENRVSKDYVKFGKKISISWISKINTWEYRINLVKFHYWFKSNFLDKSTDFSTLVDEKDSYWRDSWKKKNESEEVHFYCCLKIWISDDEKYVKWIISVPRVKEWVTTNEINTILKILFKSIFKERGCFRDIRPAYSEEDIRLIFWKATEIRFVKDENPWSYFSKEVEKQVWQDFVKVHSSISDESSIKKIGGIFSNFLPKSTHNEIKQELVALRNFSITTKDWTYNLEWDDFKLKYVVEVSDYINTMKITERSFFASEVLKFINLKFKNFFKS